MLTHAALGKSVQHMVLVSDILGLTVYKYTKQTNLTMKCLSRSIEGSDTLWTLDSSHGQEKEFCNS